MKKILLILLGVFFLQTAYAQNDLEHKAPTLQIGLDGLSLNKGVLDYEVIMKMVSEKKNELKLKTIQNLFLKKIDGAGGLTYSYVDNVLKAIIFEKDENLRKKIVLENTVNVVFAATYAEYFFRTASKVDLDQLKVLAGHEFKVDTSLKTSLLKDLKFEIDKVDKKSTIKANDQSAKTAFIVALLDIASECVREDPNLKRLGLMQVSYSAGYEHKNKFLQMLNGTNIQQRDAAEAIRNAMKDKLAAITNVIGLVNYVAVENSFRNADITVLQKVKVTSKQIALEKLADTLHKANDTLTLMIRKLSIGTVGTDTILQKQIANLVRVKNYLLKAEDFLKNAVLPIGKNNAYVFSDILYSVSREFVPALESITYKYPDVLGITANLREVSLDLSEILLAKLKMGNLNSDRIRPFILLVSKLYEFDRASTYSDYLAYVNDLVDLIPNQSVKNVYSNVNTFVKDYTVIHLNEKGKEVIEFNIESFLAKLQSIKKESYNPFEFHFTVGVNSGYFSSPLTYKSETFTSFSSISEKIGMKLKIFDFKFVNFRDPGETYNIFWTKWIRNGAPKDPLISNIHLLFYGSGLLYSILNTSTNKTFDAPLIGTGLGFTFVNSLDLNFSFAVPVLSDRSLKTSFKTPLINLGFDVQIGEYLSRIGNKKNKK